MGREQGLTKVMVEAMKPIRTLIVDDNARFLESLSNYLSRRESIDVVQVANSGEEALLAFSACRPELVLVDLVMPTMDGLAVTRKLKSLASPPRVIVLTLAEHHTYRDRALSAGADGLISKYEVTTRLMPMILGNEGAGLRLAWPTETEPGKMPNSSADTQATLDTPKPPRPDRH